MTDNLSHDIRRLIDGELNSSQVSRVLKAAADDPSACDLLAMEFATRRVYEEQHEAAWAVPNGFSDRVMEGISQRTDAAVSGAAASSRRASWTSRLLDVLRTPRPVMLRPAFAVAFVLLMALGVVLTWSGSRIAVDDVASANNVAVTESTEGLSEEVLVPFVYVDGEASSVAVAGDFNGWNPTSLQRKNIDGRIVWTGVLPITRGEHRYMFVVDGTRWESDPLAPAHRDDGFGNTNAILAL